MAEALAAVKQDLGRNAVILHTRSFRKGGLMGLIGGRSFWEVTASPNVNVPSRMKTGTYVPFVQPDADAPENIDDEALSPVEADDLRLELDNTEIADTADDAVDAMTLMKNPPQGQAPLPETSVVIDGNMIRDIGEIKRMMESLVSHQPATELAGVRQGRGPRSRTCRPDFGNSTLICCGRMSRSRSRWNSCSSFP